MCWDNVLIWSHHLYFSFCVTNVTWIYDKYTKKDAHGKPILFGAKVNISDGQIVKYSGQAQQVVLFSSRGPNVVDFQFDNVDVLKPNIMAPSYLIWATWSHLAIYNLNYMGTYVPSIFPICIYDSICIL